MSAATTGLGFELWKEGIATQEVYDRVQMKASTQFYDGDACIMTDGILAQVTAAQLPSHIYTVMVTPSTQLRPGTANLSTTIGERCLAAIIHSSLKFYSPLVANSLPTFNGTAANANSTATSVLFTGAGSTGDFNTGTIYVPSLGQQRTVTNDVVGGGVHTLTVTPAFSRPVTTGDTIILVPFSQQNIGVKFAATVPYQGVSTAVADLTGGHINIQEVVLGPQGPDVTTGNTILYSGNFVPYVVVTFS